MIDESVFAPGKVKYNSFDISFDMPFDKQIESLTEDIILVEFEHGFIIDIGWYPEFDPEGKLVVQLILNECWDKPVKEEVVADLNEMYEVIKQMKIVAVTENH